MILDDVFSRFHNSEAEILRITGYDDYENTSTITVVRTVKGDLQPYSGELLQRDYGLNRECQKRFFCKADNDIKCGVYLRINGVVYIAEYIADWSMGLVVMLREVRLDTK